MLAGENLKMLKQGEKHPGGTRTAKCCNEERSTILKDANEQLSSYSSEETFHIFNPETRTLFGSTFILNSGLQLDVRLTIKSQPQLDFFRPLGGLWMDMLKNIRIIRRWSEEVPVV